VTLASLGVPFGEAGVACAGNRVAVPALEGFLPEDGLADLDDPNGFFHILVVFNGVVWPVMAEEVDRLGDKQMVLLSAVHEGVVLRPVPGQGPDHLFRCLVDQCHGGVGLAEMAIHGRDRFEENLQDIQQSPNDPEPWCTSSIRRAWKRGCNENANGLIRKYLRKSLPVSGLP
jgi:hypothetical protein